MVKQITVSTSVVKLINQYTNIMLITDEKEKDDAILGFFNEERTHVKESEDWDDLSPDERNLVITTLEDVIQKTSSYFEELHSVPNLRLVKE